MAPDVHTPLETYLLFQILHPLRHQHPPSFGPVSELLQKNDVLQNSDSFNADRLTPDALKILYLQTLKEEARAEVESQDQNGVNAAQVNPRKRKVGTPPLETVDEAVQYLHLLPQLLSRLYFHYRDDTIRAIKDEEVKYKSLEERIHDLELADSDARKKQQDAAARDSQGVPSIQNLLRETEEDSRPQLDMRDRSLSNGQSRPESIRPILNGTPSHPGSAENVTPYLPPPQHPAHGYPLPSPTTDVHRRNSSQTHAGPSPGTRTNQGPLPAPERSSASPIILPPPAGMLRTSGPPSGPLDTLPDIPGQPYRSSPAMPSPRQVQTPSARPHPHQLPAPRNYPSNVQQPYPVYDSQGYPVPYQPYNQPPMYHPHAGSMQPYPAHGSHYNPSPYPPPVPSQPAAYYPHPSQYQQTPVQPSYSHQGPKFFDHRTPVSATSGKQRSSRPTPISTSASSTRWKNVDTPGSVRTSRSPIRPPSREISPISAPGSPVPEASPPKDVNSPPPRATRRQRGRPPRVRGTTDIPKADPASKKSRGSALNRGRGGRAGSTVSSTAADSPHARTRSQSVANELSEEPANATQQIKPESFGASGLIGDAASASFVADDRNQDLGSAPEHESTETNRTSTKRKRDEPSNMPAPTFPSPPPRTPNTATSKPGYILGTRNFPRASNYVHSAIVGHRVGSLFSKPLSDRNAPGYKDLIYRPQDMKSIKAAVNAGSKAFAAAAEESGEPAAGASPNVWVPESEDLVPPKGIVNSAQFEKEVMRMFANAVMFNPDLAENRGLGPAFRTRLRRREGGFALGDGDDAAAIAAGQASPGNGEAVKGEIGVAAPMEGAMVKDTREMFEDVEKIVDQWIAVERASEEGPSSVGGAGTPASTGKTVAPRLRGGDGDGDEADAADLGGGEGGEEMEVRETVEVETVEPGRKRRRR